MNRRPARDRRPHRCRGLAAWSLFVALLGLGIGCSADGETLVDQGADGPAKLDAGAFDGRARDTGPAKDGGDGGAQEQVVNLPADEGPHQEQTEWWYYTGVLDADGGARYGFELVTFQAVVAGYAAYVAHYAITDLSDQSFHIATHTSFTPQPQPSEGFAFDVDGWKMAGHAGNDTLSAAMPGYAIDLTLAASKPYVLQYGDGAMQIGSSRPFYYYSYPRMAVSGTLTVGDAQKSVTGQVWMDHQWGELGAGFSGWDWFSVRLEDNTELMLFVVRTTNGTDFAGGTLIDDAGKAHPLAEGDFAIEAKGSWTSPHNGDVYPQNWTLGVPKHQLSVDVTTLVADQEFYEQLFQMPVYWEGLCDVSGTRAGAAVKGHAYVELTGP